MNQITSHQVRRVQLVSAAKPHAVGGFLRAVLVGVARGTFAALAVVGFLFVGVLATGEPAAQGQAKAQKVTT